MENKNKDNEKKPIKGKATCKMCDAPLPSSTDQKTSPFCSERCRLQDLSKWFGENYRIASHQAPDTKDETQD